MISYFKYDNGNAFTLDGVPYSGYFHIIDDTVFSGKKPSKNSRQLSPNNTLLSELFINKSVFDGVTPTLNLTIPSALDILDDNTLFDFLNRTHENNLKIYKNSIFINPNALPYDYLNTFFYTLTSTEADIRADDLMYGKNVYTHSDPFSYSEEWSFLDRVTSGSFLVDNNDNFIYYCIADNATYALSGTFNDPNKKLTVVSKSTGENDLKIEQDYNSDELFFYKNDTLSIYDLSKYENCNNLFLIDQISLSATPENIKYYKIGYNKRSEYVDGVIYIKNKYSNEIFLTLPLSQLNLDSLLGIDIRKEDDNVIIIGIKNNKTYLIFFDVDDYNATFRYEELLYADNASGVFFLQEDSDFFYLEKQINEIQTESKDASSTEIRSLANINNRLSESRSSNFFYIKDYIFNTTEEKINTIQIKFNSNRMKSNSYNNLTYTTLQKKGYLYFIIHNVGRIYVSKTKTTFYQTFVPQNLIRNFDKFSCNSSSLGLSFNTSILNIVKDTLNIATLIEKVKISMGDLVNPLNSLIPTPELQFEVDNLFLNGNETINVVSIQRILVIINELQKKLVHLS